MMMMMMIKSNAGGENSSMPKAMHMILVLLLTGVPCYPLDVACQRQAVTNVTLTYYAVTGGYCSDT
jgi:hypothetical protein